MASYKFIYWRNDVPEKDGRPFANVHLLVGYNQCSIADFQAMAAELRQTFPQAKDDEIHCGQIHKSNFCDKFSIITWNGNIPRDEYPGWSQRDKSPEYCW